MSEHSQWFYSAARCADGRIRLSPPLACVFSVKDGFGGVLTRDRTVYAMVHQGRQGAVSALRSDGSALWSRRFPGVVPGFVPLVSEHGVVVSAGAERKEYCVLLDHATGAEKARVERLSASTILRNGERFVWFKWTRDPTMGLASVRDFSVNWSVSAGSLPGQKKWEYPPAADEHAIFVGLGDRLHAFSQADGKRLWAADLTELGGPASMGQWDVMVSQGLVVIRTGGGTAAFEAATGKLVWHVPQWGTKCIYDGRVYMSSPTLPSGGFYRVFDLQTGRLLLDREMKPLMRKLHPRFTEITTCINVSETHVFGGEMGGRVWAWERETGEPVWYDQPPGATAFIGVLPVIAGGRLYICSWTTGDQPTYLYCYEEASAAQASSAPSPAAVDARTAKAAPKKAEARSKRPTRKAAPRATRRKSPR